MADRCDRNETVLEEVTRLFGHVRRCAVNGDHG